MKILKKKTISPLFTVSFDWTINSGFLTQLQLLYWIRSVQITGICDNENIFHAFDRVPFEKSPGQLSSNCEHLRHFFFSFWKIKKNKLGRDYFLAGSLFPSSKLAMDLVLKVKRQTQKEGKSKMRWRKKVEEEINRKSSQV